jgi:hypothetical protein
MGMLCEEPHTPVREYYDVAWHAYSWRLITFPLTPTAHDSYIRAVPAREPNLLHLMVLSASASTHERESACYSRFAPRLLSVQHSAEAIEVTPGMHNG